MGCGTALAAHDEVLRGASEVLGGVRILRRLTIGVGASWCPTSSGELDSSTAPAASRAAPRPAPSSHGPVRTCSWKSPTPHTPATSGLASVMPGWDATSRPACKAFCSRKKPPPPTISSTQVCQVASIARNPPSRTAATALTRAAIRPDATPAAIPASTVLTAGRRVHRPATRTPAITAVVTPSPSSQVRRFADSGSPPVGDRVNSTTATPRVIAARADHSRARRRPPRMSRDRMRQKGNSITITSCTRDTGPLARAITCSTKPAARVTIPAAHTGRRQISTQSSFSENCGRSGSASVALRNSTKPSAPTAAAASTSTITSIGSSNPAVR